MSGPCGGLLKLAFAEFSWTKLFDDILNDMENNCSKGDKQRVYLTFYHLVWTPKRQKTVLTGQMAKDCKTLMEARYKEWGWGLIELYIQQDHVHLFVETFLTVLVSEVVKQCKGVTSHELRENYPFLKKLPSLWTRSYFSATAGNASAETI